MADIKPIETIYNGYKFRSRLEARWAVYFDSLSIPYEYELEGFQLDGAKYLPDFFLPEIKVHVEVKPHRELSRKDIRKMILFGVDAGMPLLLIVGTPTNENMYLVSRRSFDTWANTDEEHQEDDRLLNVFWESLETWAHVALGGHPVLPGFHLTYKTPIPYDDYHLSQALIKAKQARFEHGQSG